MLGYKVNNQLFFNPFAAFVWASQNDPHCFPEFAVYDAEFGQCDWSKEPAQSWQELLDLRATQLRLKYDRLILAFSGGTDSVTVYNAFKKQNIFIDEIIVTYSTGINNAPKENVDWLLKNHYDPRTKITAWHRQDPNLIQEYSQQDWILLDRGHLRRFELTIPGPEIDSYLQESWGGQRWCLITGHEKPHLMFRDGRWWATHLDGVYHAVLGYPNLELFFLTPDLPELHIKQHHTLLQNLKRSGLQFHEGWNSCQHLGKNSAQEYDWFARACGRDLDIIAGASWCQKNYNNHTRFDNVQAMLDQDCDQLINVEPLLQSYATQGHDLAKNYLTGWSDLQIDNSLIQYMTTHKLLGSTTQMVKNYNQIWSKFYALERAT